MNKFFMFLKGKILYVALAATVVVAAVTTVILNNNKGNSTVVYKTIDESSINDESSLDDNGENSSTSETVTTKVTSSKAVSKTSKTSTATTTTKKTYNFPCDVNTIDKDGLMQIDGIGNVIAQRIIDYRNSVGIIYNMGLLENVDGIGYATLAKLKNYLYVSDNYYREIEQNQNNDNENETTDAYAEMTTMATMTTMEMMTTMPTQSAEVPQRKNVNINTANAQEIADSLLIDKEMADKIIELRGQITTFSNSLELLYVDGMSENLLSQLTQYIEI